MSLTLVGKLFTFVLDYLKVITHDFVYFCVLKLKIFVIVKFFIVLVSF